MTSNRIYLAGPQVFLRDPFAVAEAKKSLCRQYGFEGVFPMDQEVELDGLSPEEQARKIFETNVSLMDGCDMIIADMTPFRGESMDVGTAFEMGYMYSQGKPIFGYSNNPDVFADRSAKLEILTKRPGESGVLEDHNQMRIEGFGKLVDNLMCGCCLKLPPVLLPSQIFVGLSGDELYLDLTAFEQCLCNVRKFFTAE